MNKIDFVQFKTRAARRAAKAAAGHLTRPLGPHCRFVKLQHPYTLLKHMDELREWGERFGAPFDWTAVSKHASLKLNLLVLDFHDESGPLAFKLRFG